MYNVAYDTSVGVKHYCARNMPLAEAKRQLANFTARYLNADGTPRTYPNGKGVYDVRNPRVVGACARQTLLFHGKSGEQ